MLYVYNLSNYPTRVHSKLTAEIGYCSNIHWTVCSVLLFRVGFSVLFASCYHGVVNVANAMKRLSLQAQRRCPRCLSKMTNMDHLIRNAPFLFALLFLFQIIFLNVKGDGGC